MEFKVYHSLPEAAKSIREEVFVVEQGFKYEFDDLDLTSTHIVGYINGLPVATCRVLFNEQRKTYAVGRIAVIKEYRGKGLGAEILREGEEYIRKIGGGLVSLHAQVRAAGFYEKQGYIRVGEIDDEEGYPHIWMTKEL